MAFRHHYKILSILLVGTILYAEEAWSIRGTRQLAAATPPPQPTPAKKFMASLPLNISLVNPQEIATSGETVYMSGIQDITVVFSRPVIALGSDLEDDGFIKKVFPFRLSCDFPGKARWVTTSIARFDPIDAWPSDLSCDLIWSTTLKSYDGVKLQLGGVPNKSALQSSSLELSYVTVVSDLATNLTNGEWTGFQLEDGDKAPEVPPDGRVLLHFSYNVNLKMLSEALQLLKGHPDYDQLTLLSPQPRVAVRSCISAAPWSSDSSSSLDVNVTCAEVEVGPVLIPDTWYTLRLPAGSRYNTISGPLARNLDTSFSGLRPFRIPFRSPIPASDNDTVLQYTLRRWDMFLPHGLAAGTTAAELAASISVCERVPSTTAFPAGFCNPIAFNLSLAGKAVARLSVPSAQPAVAYRVTVANTSTIKDGFGQSLQASSTEIGMDYVPYEFTGPRTRSTSLAVLETGVSSMTTEWPYITTPPSPLQTLKGLPSSISLFTVDMTDELAVAKLMLARRLMSGYPNSGLAAMLFGEPYQVTPISPTLRTASSAANWTTIAVPLGPAPVQVLYACCIPSGPYYSPPSFQVVSRTNLSISAVQTGPILVAWVTNAVQDATPVAGANVSFYFVSYSAYYDSSSGVSGMPYKIASCVTNVDGFCTAQLPDSTNDGSGELSVVATLATPQGLRVAMLPYSGWVQSTSAIVPYVGKLVIDRKLVEPGDSLKVTGFVQAASLSGLSLPSELDIILQVQPNWNPSSDNGNVVEVTRVKLTAATGTFHAEIPVPENARMATYSISAIIFNNTAHHSGPGVAATAAVALDMVSSGEYDYRFVVPDDRVQLTSESFTVSEPRTPTAELKLVTDPWVTPSGILTVNVTALSYIGASVDNSVVTVIWSVPGVVNGSGVLKLTTDTEGFATAKIDLAPVAALAMAQGLTIYGSVGVTAEWIGPTRERIVQGATIRVAEAPVEVRITTSLITNIPGMSFTVAASITSVIDGSQLANLPINITLQPASAASAACPCAANITCTTVSSASWVVAPASCRLALPCVGLYKLEACANVLYGGRTIRVCGNDTRGRDPSSWAQDPMSTSSLLVTPQLELDKPDGYRIGDIPVLRFDNPYSSARLLVVWGTEYGVKTKVYTGLLASSLVSITLEPLGSECAFGCSISAILDVPRVGPSDLPSLPPATQLPRAALFDPRAPHSHSMSLAINILRDNELAIAVNVSALASSATGGVETVMDSNGARLVVVEPGATAEISVRVDTAASNGSVEVTVYAIEKAFLDLVPYPLPQPALDMVFRLSSFINQYQTDGYRIAPGAVQRLFEKLLSRLTTLDPWLPVDTNVIPPSSGMGYVDMSDEDLLNLFVTRITGRAPSRWGDMWPTMQDVVNVGGARPNTGMNLGSIGNSNVDKGDESTGNDGSGAAGTLAPGELRRTGDFVVTPLFAHQLIGAGGVAVFNLTAPPNLGAFVIRAFAAAGSVAKYGSAEGKLVVRRSLSLTASAPPFVRMGDSFEAGVVVTLASLPSTVTVTVHVLKASSSPLRVVGSASRSVVFLASGSLQQEVRFNFSTRAMGTATLVFSARDVVLGKGSDAVELDIEVQGQQGDVWMATSFALASNASAAKTSGWVEGLVLPSAVPGSGGITLTAGVGYLPAITALYDNLLSSEMWRTEPYAQTAVMWVTLPALLSYYNQSTTDAQAAQVTQAASELTALTNSWLGLQWTPASRWSNWQPNRVDIPLNTWAIFLAKFFGLQGSVGTLVNTWVDSVKRQIVTDVNTAKSWGYVYDDWNTLAWIRLALGTDWTPETDTDLSKEVRTRLTLNTMLAAYTNTSTRWQFDRQTRVVLSLALLGMGSANPNPGLVAATVKQILGAARVQGRTTYIAVAPGSASASSVEDQALGLLLLLRYGTRNQLVPKLAACIASPTSTSRGIQYNYAPWSAQALVVAVLSEYDRYLGSNQPSLHLKADVNDLAVLSASFRASSNHTVTNFTAWEALPPSRSRGLASELKFAVNGTGEVTVTAALNFVPASLASFPTYRGISVDIAIQMVDPLTGQSVGPRVSAVPLGSVVMLTVQVITPDDLSAVTLSVMMPGGLEPMDPNVVSDAGSSCFVDWFSSYTVWQSFYPRGWWWPVCPVQETRPSLVTYKYAALRSGTSTVSIKAVAATVGRFVVPPVRVSADEQPELMGATAATTFVVCGSCTAPTTAAPLKAPKACPGDCSGSGACNLRLGVCVCDNGFKGADCSDVVDTRRRIH